MLQQRPTCQCAGAAAAVQLRRLRKLLADVLVGAVGAAVWLPWSRLPCSAAEGATARRAACRRALLLLLPPLLVVLRVVLAL